LQLPIGPERRERLPADYGVLNQSSGRLASISSSTEKAQPVPEQLE
jgi:hypothetical protein